MLVALTVMAILIAIVTPKMSRIIQGTKLTGVMDELASDVNNTRMLAIRKGQTGSITVNANGLGYSMVVGTDTLKRFTLSTQEANTRIAPAGTSIQFNNRGMITAGGGTTGTTLMAIHGTDTARVTVSGIGRVYREY
jgi:Tfp pilus assembly protein FimT